MSVILNAPLTVAAPVVVNLNPATDTACLVQITNPGTITIFIEGSMDAGTSQIDLASLSTVDNTTVTNNGASGFTPTAAKNRAYIVPCIGCNQIRVRATALTGAPLVSIRPITNPTNPLPMPIY
jgi:hypothetical protein